MNFPKNADHYIRQWAGVPALLAQEPDDVNTEEALFFLCNRDALADAPELVDRLRPLDAAVAVALRAAVPAWRAEFARVADRCGWLHDAWWLAIWP